MASFDIVMPSHGRPELLHSTIDSVANCALPAGFGKLILVENGGRFGAEEICSTFMEKLPITYIYEESAGAGKARNIGVNCSDADYLIFLDSDVKVVPGALAAYDNAFQKSDKSSFFGGPLYPEYETPPPDWLREFLTWSAKGQYLGNTNKVVDEPVFLGGNFAVPRGAFEVAGYFEGPCAVGRNKGGVGEETRLQQRLLQHGFTGIYVAGGGVIHPVPAHACDQQYVLNRNRRYGRTEGEIAAEQSHSHRLFFGAPLYLWRSVVSSTAALPLAYNIFTSETERFERKRAFVYDLESVLGYRHAYLNKRTS